MRKQLCIYLGFLFLAAALLPSCMKYEDIKFRGIGNLKIGKIGMKESTMEMDMLFSNPNNLGAALNNAEGQAWIQDFYIGNFQLNEEVKIPAKSNFAVPVRLSVNLKDLLKNSLTLMFQDSVTIKVDGNAKLSKGSFLKSIPLKYSGKKSTSELMQALK